MKSLLTTLILSTLFLNAVAQDTLLCKASTLYINSYEPGSSGPNITIALSPETNVADYTLNHFYDLGADNFEDMITSVEPFYSLTLNLETQLHELFPVNRCTDDSLHFGSTLFLDYTEADPFCPPPTNLQILDLNNNFVSFQWDDNPEVDSWNVAYLPGGIPASNGDTPEPFWEQVLSTTDSIHTFEVYSICPGFTPGNVVVFSAKLRFTIITIDDIKFLTIPCPDLTEIVEDAYHMYCSKHGFYGPNKQDFISIHDSCTTTSVPRLDLSFSDVRVFPNPVRGSEMQVSLSLNKSSVLSFALLDLNGRLVQHFPGTSLLVAGPQTIKLPIREAPPGMYFLRIGDGQGQRYVKVVFS